MNRDHGRVKPQYRPVGRLTCWILLSSLVLVVGCGTRHAVPPDASPFVVVQATVAQRLNQPVSLRTDVVNEHDGWIFVAGRPLTAGGERIDYSGTEYATEIAGGFFDDNFMALLKRSEGIEGAWQLIELSIGASDAPFVGWFQRYGLPLSLAGTPAAP